MLPNYPNTLIGKKETLAILNLVYLPLSLLYKITITQNTLILIARFMLLIQFESSYYHLKANASILTSHVFVLCKNSIVFYITSA